MGATLADGGVNRITKERVVDTEQCKRVLVVMATPGTFEQFGDSCMTLGCWAQAELAAAS